MRPSPERNLNLMVQNAAFVEKLVAELPWLQATYREHLADNAELLPHVFMGDVCRLVVDAAAEQSKRADLTELFRRFEDVLAVPEHPVQEVIYVSFVEHMHEETEVLRLINTVGGVSLKRAISVYC